MALIAAMLTIIAVDYVAILIKRRKLPPGPIPLPLAGNTFSYPSSKPWLLMEKLSHMYESPIVTFWVGRTPTIWLNDCWSASELLDKRENYCSRPHLVVLGDLAGGQTNIVTMYYGDRWRLHRKLTHYAVGVQKVRLYRSFQDDESKVTAFNLLSCSDEYERHFERFAASTVSIIGTGRRIASIHDTLITDVLAAAHHAGESIVPGKSFPIIMETFPIMARFPPLQWLFKEAMNKGRDFYYNMAKRASEQPEESFAKRIFNVDRPQYDLSKEEIAALVGNLFGAGTDTSSSTLCTFLLACCSFPEVLPPAWEELDWVVGHQRSPTVDDFDQLPYVSSFVKEVFRWRPVSVLGGQPHAPIQDDYYQGYLIPSGVSITGNLWAIHRNKTDFPDPDRFCPKRYLKDNHLYRPFPNERGHMAFGWGRRICSGRPLAEQGTQMMVARMLWGFRIESGTDASTGAPAKLDIFDYTNGVAIKPRPFKCRLIPRNEQIRLTIKREGLEALENLKHFGNSPND
ncbi:hypothetical protein M433DRAFT_67689 [Acidomyces richmondensis BFW]|nr:hypothetical protein M433DRAFT_67689 [Acidomyces richmondensis BFW]